MGKVGRTQAEWVYSPAGIHRRKSGGRLRPSNAGRSARARRGFTLVELVLGMAITTLVMSAVAAVMVSVAEGWDQGRYVQSVSISELQLQVRLGRIFQGAAYVAQCQSGVLGGVGTPATIFFWMNDNWGSTPDGIPEWGEMAVIAYDPATQSLYLYSAMPTALMSGAQLTAASQAVNWSQATVPSAISGFESATWVQKTTLAGPGTNTVTSDTTVVSGARVAVDWLNSTSQKPTVEFQVTESRGTESATMYGSFVLRLADQPPND
jgi:prepilin-type N-terminal cleavage/methylation domain-containing protein